MTGIRMAEVRHVTKGHTTTIKETSWKNWGSAKAKDNDVRQGYVLVRLFTVDHKGKEIASDPLPQARTFGPKFKEQENAAAPKSDSPNPPQQTAPPVPPVQQQAPQGKPDQLSTIPALTLKVQEALYVAGIRTYKELATADPAAIGKVLDGMVPPLPAKKEQIPAWQKAASEFVKQSENSAMV